jgi:hypothetical protein
MDDYRTFDVEDIYDLDKRTIDVLIAEGVIEECRKCSSWDSPTFHLEGTLPVPGDIAEEGGDECFTITTEILRWALKLAKSLSAQEADLSDVSLV